MSNGYGLKLNEVYEDLNDFLDNFSDVLETNWTNTEVSASYAMGRVWDRYMDRYICFDDVEKWKWRMHTKVLDVGVKYDVAFGNLYRLVYGDISRSEMSITHTEQDGAVVNDQKASSFPTPISSVPSGSDVPNKVDTIHGENSVNNSGNEQKYKEYNRLDLQSKYFRKYNDIWENFLNEFLFLFLMQY